MNNKKEMTTAVKIVFVTIALLLLIFLLPNALSEWNRPNLPIHDGDYIVWSVNGTRNGVNVTGASIWTFSNVTSHGEPPGLTSWPEYLVGVRTLLNGAVDDFETAGQFQDPQLWSLGINPFIIDMGATSYLNPVGYNFGHNDTISTAFGLKATAVFVEVINEGSNNLWASIWIDSNTGMPYKMVVIEPTTLNGFQNELSGTLTFNMLATNMMH